MRNRDNLESQWGKRRNSQRGPRNRKSNIVKWQVFKSRFCRSGGNVPQALACRQAAPFPTEPGPSENAKQNAHTDCGGRQQPVMTNRVVVIPFPG